MNTQERQNIGRKALIDRGLQVIVACCSLIGTACLIGGVNFAARVYRSWESVEHRITNMEIAVSAIQATGNNTATDVKVIKVEQQNMKEEIRELKEQNKNGYTITP